MLPRCPAASVGSGQGAAAPAAPVLLLPLTGTAFHKNENEQTLLAFNNNIKFNTKNIVHLQVVHYLYQSYRFMKFQFVFACLFDLFYDYLALIFVSLKELYALDLIVSIGWFLINKARGQGPLPKYLCTKCRL